jgi:peptidoglycan/LPS O-acetylase OafA/YrhL
LRTIIRILRSRITRQLAAVVAVMLALLLRVALAEQSITLPTYVTFYPVVFLAALLGGVVDWAFWPQRSPRWWQTISCLSL